MKGEGVGRPSIHGATHPHPALRAGLSLPGRGVSLLLRWEQAGSFLSTRSTDLHPTAGQCRGDPVGRPAGAVHVP
jgi:hypothetical protein